MTNENEMSLTIPAPDFTDESVLKEYLSDISAKKPVRHENYQDNVDHYKEMAVHIDGESPTELLEKQRPNEDPAARDYRISVFQPITKSRSKKIINTLSRIKNSKNFSIVFPSQIAATIPPEESLEQYTMKDFHPFKAIDNWLFTVVLKQDLLDANSICVWLPLNLAEVENDNSLFLKPAPFVFGSEQIVDFQSNVYYTVLLNETRPYKDEAGKNKPGCIFHIYTQNEIISATEIGEKKGKKVFEVEIVYQHNFGKTPVVEFRGELAKKTYPFRYESFIAGILADWNEALRLNSDLRVQYTNHMYLERVEIQTECDNERCGMGTERGYCLDDDMARHACRRCKGSGYISGRGPFNTTVVRADNALNPDAKTIFPGVQYIDKPIEIIQETKKEVQDCINQGFSSINMEILQEVGANQSGVAKTIDRTDMDAFIGDVSDNMFRILEESFDFINLWRYNEILSDKELEDNMPAIIKPTNFDVISYQSVMNEIKSASEAKVGSPVIQKMNLDFVDKRYNDPKFTSFSKNLIELDPLYGKNEDEKGFILSNMGISKEDYIVSCQIERFMLDAIAADENFLDKTRVEKQTVLRALAKKEIQTLEVSKPIITNPDGTPVQ